MLNTKAAGLLLLLGVFAAGPSWAAKKAESELTRGEFLERKAQIEGDLAPGRPLAGLSSSKRMELHELLGRMERRLDGHENSGELSRNAQVELFNEQERVNALIGVNSDKDRVVCRRDRKTGTNRTTTVCRSVGEIKADREKSLDDLHRLRTGIGKPNS